VANGKLRTLQRVDIATGAATATVSITPGVPVAVATGSGSIWVGSRSGFASNVPQRVTRVDPETAQVVGQRTIPLGVQDLAVGEGAVWVTSRRSGANRVTRWNLTTNRLTTIPAGQDPGGIAVGEGAVWVADREGSTVTRIEPDPPFRRTTIRVGRGATDVAVGNGLVWVANRADGTVSLVDPGTNRVAGGPVRVGPEPFALAARGRRVWVTCLGSDTLVRLTFRGGA